MKIEKKLLKDKAGRPLTQGLFLEHGYGEYAVYSLKDDDYEYKGRIYPSLKKLFLECEDPTEYEFSVDHLLGWAHWQRLNKNKALSKHFEEWREELELKLRSQGVRCILDMTADNNFQAAKWLSDRGWEKRGAGRPSKQEQLKEERMSEKLENEFSADIIRMRG